MSQEVEIHEAESSIGEYTDEMEQAHIVDCDFHLMAPLSEIFPYVDDPLVKKKLERTPFDGMALGGYPNHFIAQFASDSDDMGSAHGLSVKQEHVERGMEHLGIDRTVVTPWDYALPYQGYPPVANAVAKAQTDYMLDNVISPENGIYGALHLPQWDPEASVEELARVGDRDGIVAVQTFYGDFEPLGGIEYDPVFEKIVELGLPILQHGSGHGGQQWFNNGRETHMEAIVTDWPFTAMVNAENMITTGVFDSFPELEIVIQEAGTFWVPFLAHRSDEVYSYIPEEHMLTERLFERGQQYIERMPSEYLFEHFYVTTQPCAIPSGKAGIDGWLELCRAEDMFLFSSDYPHESLDTIDWVFRTPMDDALRTKILHENAEGIFDFE